MSSDRGMHLQISWIFVKPKLFLFVFMGCKEKKFASTKFHDISNHFGCHIQRCFQFSKVMNITRTENKCFKNVTYLVRSSKGLVSLESLSSNDKLLNAPAVGPVISVFNFIVRTIDCNVSTNGLLSSPQGWEVKSNWIENLEKLLSNSNKYVF